MRETCSSSRFWTEVDVRHASRGTQLYVGRGPVALRSIAPIDDHPEHARLLSDEEKAGVSLDTPAKAPELEAVKLLQKVYPQRTITSEASVPAGLDGVDAAVGDELVKLKGSSLNILLKIVVAPEGLSIKASLQWLRIHQPT